MWLSILIGFLLVGGIIVAALGLGVFGIILIGLGIVFAVVSAIFRAVEARKSPAATGEGFPVPDGWAEAEAAVLEGQRTKGHVKKGYAYEGQAHMVPQPEWADHPQHDSQHRMTG
jgi:hypothetical protein